MSLSLFVTSFMGVAPDRAKNESWAAFLILCLLVGGEAAGLAAGPPNVRHMGEGGVGQ